MVSFLFSAFSFFSESFFLLFSLPKQAVLFFSFVDSFSQNQKETAFRPDPFRCFPGVFFLSFRSFGSNFLPKPVEKCRRPFSPLCRIEKKEKQNFSFSFFSFRLSCPKAETFLLFQNRIAQIFYVGCNAVIRFDQFPYFIPRVHHGGMVAVAENLPDGNQRKS